jgi:hypothetical protein
MTSAGLAESFFVRVLSGSPRRVYSGMWLQDNAFQSGLARTGTRTEERASVGSKQNGGAILSVSGLCRAILPASGQSRAILYVSGQSLAFL